MNCNVYFSYVYLWINYLINSRLISKNMSSINKMRKRRRKQKRNEIAYQNEQSHSIIAIEDDPVDNICDYTEYGTIEIILNIRHQAIQEEEEEEDEEEQNDYDNEDEEEEYDDDDDDDDDDEDDEDDDGDEDDD